jgi:ribonucleoside-diphosphate reductase alpha chain
MIRRERRVHRVSDSIEGWAHAVQMLIDSYLHRGYYEDYYDWRFDFSLIRPKGSPIRSGGIAPGSKPLSDAMDKICFDIMMLLSEAVLSGGVRRSASIAIFDPDDELMKNAKVGNWYIDHPYRAYANISAGLSITGEDRSTVDHIVELARQWGEPGVMWQANEHHGTNPCAEIGLFPYIVTNVKGEQVTEITLDLLERREYFESIGYEFTSGWAVCNLTEINGAMIKSRSDFLEACRAAAHIGTLQAGYTYQGYLLLATKVIMQQEALLGVSIAQVCVDVNRETAEKIGIKPASRVTTIKPSGNTSTIAGTSAGVHPFHARRYIRRMRIAKVNPVWAEISTKVPGACIDLDEHTGVVAFACSAPEGALTREDDSALAHLERVRLVYQHWVKPGSANSRVEGLTHNVSNTCTVKPDEWDDVADFLWDARGELRGVALLGWFGDSQYDNAPYQTVEAGSEAEELWRRLIELDWSEVDLYRLDSDYFDAQLEPACSGGTCSL